MIHETFLGGHNIQTVRGAEKLLRKRVDFSLKTLDAGGGDVAPIFHIGPNDIIMDVWVDVISACPANSTIDVGYGTNVNYWGNAIPLDVVGTSNRVLTATLTWDPETIPANGSVSNSVEVNGASYGDDVIVRPNIDVGGILCVGNVYSPNEVEVWLQNATGGEIILPLALNPAFQVVVNKSPLSGFPLTVSVADTVDIKATTDTADVNINSGKIDVYMRVLRFK